MNEHCCNELYEHVNNTDDAIRYIDKFREYGIEITDGGTAIQIINYCPWCGSKLPSSLRDKWFDIIFDDLDLDGPDDPGVPDKMKTDEWWNKKN
ncbi:MAG: hypothetical protein OQL19_02535 [Gammaproteobacteria bacterium]|nr:hypothetical protein [Gammaproteobacteria bacterium]